MTMRLFKKVAINTIGYSLSGLCLVMFIINHRASETGANFFLKGASGQLTDFTLNASYLGAAVAILLLKRTFFDNKEESK